MPTDRAASGQDGVERGKALGPDRPRAPMTGTSQPGRSTPPQPGAASLYAEKVSFTMGYDGKRGQYVVTKHVDQDMYFSTDREEAEAFMEYQRGK